MEPIIEKVPFQKRSLISFDSAAEMWRFVCDYVHRNRLQELNEFWAAVENASEKLDEHFFLREHAWCVYVAGFSAATIAKKFPMLMQAHKIENKDGHYIPITKDNLVDPLDPSILSVFGNKRKSTSIQKMRAILLEKGWSAFKESLYSCQETKYSESSMTWRFKIEPATLTGLPGIGPVLACHLSRNLGNKEVVKPDIHLSRLAKRYGFEDAKHMCRSLSYEPAGRTDLILWLAARDLGTK